MNLRAVAAAILAITLGGLGVPTAVASPVPASSPGLQPMMASTQLWVGENDLLIDLLDSDGSRFPAPGPDASVVLVGPDGLERGTIELERIRLANTGRYLSRGRALLDEPGAWTATVWAVTATGDRLDGVVGFEVLEDVGTPALGQPAIAVATPTVKTAPVASITSDRDPVPQLYWWSLDQALRARRPILFVIDTARPGVADGCGSAIGEARIMRGNFPGLTVIHAEPFVYGDDGAVAVSSDQGPTRVAPWAAAWGVAAPPWMFVIAADGTVTAKFQGVFGTDELLSALRRVAPYAPGGH